LFVTSKIAAAGTVALGLSEYLGALWPALSARGTAVAAIAGFTLLNCLGVRRSSRVNLAVVSVSIGALLLFVAVGVSSLRVEHFRPFAPSGVQGTLEAAALLFFAYTGYARIATLAEEVRDPERLIPRAIMITIGGAVLLYLAVAFVAVGAIGADRMAATAAPLHTAALAFHVPWMPTVVALGGIAAMLGVILSQLLGLSRVVFAMARRGDLPQALGHVHPRLAVPQRAVLLVGAIAAVVAASGTLREVASAASFTILLYYGIANVAALRMPRDQKLYPDAVPIVGLAGCTVLALSLPLSVVTAGFLVLGSGFVVRRVVRRAP
jgi:APA family basic amino acid/polyamine antiporter